MASVNKLTVVCVFVAVALISLSYAEIHRAVKKPPTRHRGNTQESMSKKYSTETWVFSMISASLVGLSGIFPLLVIPLEAGKALRKGGM